MNELLIKEITVICLGSDGHEGICPGLGTERIQREIRGEHLIRTFRAWTLILIKIGTQYFLRLAERVLRNQISELDLTYSRGGGCARLFPTGGGISLIMTPLSH